MLFYFGHISRILIHVKAAAVRWVLFKPWVSNLQTARLCYAGSGHIFRLYIYIYIYIYSKHFTQELMRLDVQLIVIFKRAACEAAYNEECGHWPNKGGHL